MSYHDIYKEVFYLKKLKNILKDIGYKECSKCQKYSSAGNAFYIDNEEINGIYWFYETEYFIIDIHDFFIKKEMIVNSFPDIKPYMSFSSTYIITANGEWFNPYQNMTSNTVFIMNVDNSDIRFLLHGNYPYFSVGINFKKNMIEKYLDTSNDDISNIFLDTRDLITKHINKLANSILNCKMTSTSASLFFEAKAKEWLSITLNAYEQKKYIKSISEKDEKAIENVASYIDDHLTFDIPQELLEKISMMSGTKLKNTFKQKYQMSITEYTQRKRINMAENLILTTNLDIKDIAKSVGYSSHSRFTTLFKRYKIIYPKDLKRFNDQYVPSICCKNNNKIEP
ncbi:AraC family transcriptional regulator [Clostridioides difficile]|nr:AraC family transcriptional regulator [Clostridioides difficile]